MNSNEIKKTLYDLGVDICGIASIDRFIETPKGFHPTDTLPSCKSVIIFGKKFLKSTITCNNAVPYTLTRNMISIMIDTLTIEFCEILENENIVAVPIGAIGPSIYDKEANRSRGIISLKHSAVLAGMGYIGKSSLLITPEYGNMVWLEGVLLDIDLEQDEIIQEKCPKNCNLCIENCPVNAIKKDSLEIDQKRCWENAFEGGEIYFKKVKCYKCRTICPRCFGFKNK